MLVWLFAIIFFIFYLWVFVASGTVVASFFRIRTISNYTNLLIGAFTYFCTLSFSVMPLEFFYNLNYIILIYYLIAINIIYVLVLFIFIRLWFNFVLLKWEHLWFIVGLACFIGLFFLKNKFITSSGDYTDWYKAFINHNNITGVDSLALNRSIGLNIYNGTNLWYMNSAMWLLITQVQSVEVLFNNIVFLIDPIIFGAIFVTIILHFIKPNQSKLIVGLIGLVVLLGIKLLLYYFGYDSWTPENMFYNLMFTILVLATIYYKNSFRMRYMPWAISIIIASYSAFDWSSTYLLLFIIYVLGWISVLYNQNNFLKDLVKFALLPLIVFMCYTIAFGTIMLILVFASLIFLILVAIAVFYRRYPRIQMFEQIIYNNQKILVFLVPIIFLVFSIILFLASSNFNFSYWDFQSIAPSIYNQIKHLVTKQALSSIFIIISFILLGISVVWIGARDFTKLFHAKIGIDILAILIVTFFNPFTGRFWIFLFRGQALANNGAIILTTILFIILLGFLAIPIPHVKTVLFINQMRVNLNLYKTKKLDTRRTKIRVKRYNLLKQKQKRGFIIYGKRKN